MTFYTTLNSILLLQNPGIISLFSAMYILIKKIIGMFFEDIYLYSVNKVSEQK